MYIRVKIIRGLLIITSLLVRDQREACRICGGRTRCPRSEPFSVRGKPSLCLRAELRLPESDGTLMGEPKRFLTRLPPVPEARHNQSRARSFTNPGEFPEGARPLERHGETRGTEGCDSVRKLCRGEGR
eukprot:5030438-Pyramimonas_sp.AAC.1